MASQSSSTRGDGNQNGSLRAAFASIRRATDGNSSARVVPSQKAIRRECLEISDIQEEKTEAVLSGDQSVTMLHCVENQANGVFAEHTAIGYVLAHRFSSARPIFHLVF